MDLELGRPPVQGPGFGDCWVVSVLDAVHHRWPDKISRMFKDLGDGRVEVRLARHTVWLGMTFPQGCSQPKWCSCIQKALALVLGGWDKLNGGLVSTACTLLFPDLECVPLTDAIVCGIRHPRSLHAVRPVFTCVIRPRRGES